MISLAFLPLISFTLNKSIEVNIVKFVIETEKKRTLLVFILCCIFPFGLQDKVLSKYFFRTASSGSVTVRLHILQQCQYVSSILSFFCCCDFQCMEEVLWLHVASRFGKKQTLEQNTRCMWTCNKRGVPRLHALPSASVFYCLVCLSPKLALSQSILMWESLARVLKNNNNNNCFSKQCSRSFMEVAKKPRRTRTILDRIGWVPSVLLNQKW